MNQFIREGLMGLPRDFLPLGDKVPTKPPVALLGKNALLPIKWVHALQIKASDLRAAPEKKQPKVRTGPEPAHYDGLKYGDQIFLVVPGPKGNVDAYWNGKVGVICAPPKHKSLQFVYAVIPSSNYNTPENAAGFPRSCFYKR